MVVPLPEAIEILDDGSYSSASCDLIDNVADFHAADASASGIAECMAFETVFLQKKAVVHSPRHPPRTHPVDFDFNQSSKPVTALTDAQNTLAASGVWEPVLRNASTNASFVDALRAPSSFLPSDIAALLEASRLREALDREANKSASFVKSMQIPAVHLPPELLEISNASKVWDMLRINATKIWKLVHGNSSKLWEVMQEHVNPNYGLGVAVGLNTNRDHNQWNTGPAHAFPHYHVVESPLHSSQMVVYDDRQHVDGSPGSSTLNRPAQQGHVWNARAVNELDVQAYGGYVISCLWMGGMPLLVPLALVGLVLTKLWVRHFVLPKPMLPLAFISKVKEAPAAKQDIEGKGKGKALTVWDGTVATFSSIVGTGLLAMPYAFSVAGLLGGTLAILLFVGCSAYTADLLTKILNDKAMDPKYTELRPDQKEWGFLVELAYGRTAKSAITVFLIVELWGYLLSSMTTCALNLSQVSALISIESAIACTVLAAFTLTAIPSHYRTNLNVLANVSYLICGIMFITTGLCLPQQAPNSDISLMRPSGLLSAAGILVFSPASHSFYPAIMQRMEEPRRFSSCIRQAYAAACLVYLTIAIMGYGLFGNAIQPSLVKNIGVDLHFAPIPGLGWMHTAAGIAMVMKMCSNMPLILTPLNSTVEGLLQDYGGRSASWVTSGGLSNGVTVFILVLSAAVSLLFAQQLPVVLNFVGSVFCMTIAFVVPVLCYWKLAGESLSLVQGLLFCGLIIMGSFFATMGVTAIFYY